MNNLIIGYQKGVLLLWKVPQCEVLRAPLNMLKTIERDVRKRIIIHYEVQGDHWRVKLPANRGRRWASFQVTSHSCIQRVKLNDRFTNKL